LGQTWEVQAQLALLQVHLLWSPLELHLVHVPWPLQAW
jgi:hypothetical protein